MHVSIISQNIIYFLLSIFNINYYLIDALIPRLKPWAFPLVVVKAWQHGPVIESLYHEFKHFKNKPISGWSQSTIEDTDIGFEVETLFLDKIDIENKENLLKIFQTVWDSYKNYSAWGIVQKTHEKGTPWEQTYSEGKRGLIIEDELIQTYYKNFLQQMITTND